MLEKRKSVAIDGPSGAGKSTIARIAAAELGFIYVDTGAIYRSLGLYVKRRGEDPKDPRAIEPLLPDVTINIEYDNGGEQRTILNGEDVSREIRLPDISFYASAVSAHSAVRDFLMDMQRDMARRYDVIMDGRDIGTVVLPDAGLKIFLTASEEARAGRRFEEFREKGVETSFQKVLYDMRERDLRDSSRLLAPTRAAQDAITVDTSDMGLQESIDHVICLIKEQFGL